MSATDELRRLLDERGVEWESKDVDGISGFHDTRWNAYGVRWCYVEFVDNNYTKLKPIREFHCTPEQAVAATLGGGECTMNPIEWYGYPKVYYTCSECDASIYDQHPNYCPCCGAKVVER